MLTTEQIEALQAQFKSVVHIRGKNGKWEIVLRKPTRMEWKRVRSMMHNDSQRSDANETLIRMCSVYPAGPALDSLIEEWPGLPEAVSAHAEVQDMLGLSAETDAK